MFIFSNGKCVSSSRSVPRGQADMTVMNGNEALCFKCSSAPRFLMRGNF